jgi:hypothetical protein
MEMNGNMRPTDVNAVEASDPQGPHPAIAPEPGVIWRWLRWAKDNWLGLLCSILGFGADVISVTSGTAGTAAAEAAAITKATFGLKTLQEIIEADYPEPVPLVERFLKPGETGLLIARQKEGKSTLGLQMAIDVACGDPFLDRYATMPSTVLSIDYENRLPQLKKRGIDLVRGRLVENLFYKAYDFISDRDTGLDGEGFSFLQSMVRKVCPGLLIIDPLRFAIEDQTSDERVAVNALDRVSKLRKNNPQMAVLLVHHLKKAQGDFTPSLRGDMRSWVDRIYGSQALLAHVETIWGLENDESGCTLGTLSRSEDSFTIDLAQEPESQRFIVSADSAQIERMPKALKDAWDLLPKEFVWREASALGVPQNTFYRLIRFTRPIGLITQDPLTKRYRKAAA